MTDDEEDMHQHVPSYFVCNQCMCVCDTAHDLCPVCSELKQLPYQEFPQKVEAEAYAVGQWLREGYSITDVRDPYFNPRR
jgi:hypothetical protein